MRFAVPHILLAIWGVLLLGLVLLVLARRERRQEASFAEARFWNVLSPGRSRSLRGWKSTLRLVAMAFVILALAQPEWGARIESVRRRGVDIVVLLDTSLSMQARDLAPSRADHAHRELGEFLDHLHGDRVALVPFAGSAILSCPLTLDYGAARMLLDAAGPGVVPRPGTAIAKAIRLGTRVFEGHEKKYKVMILVTDGEDQEGDVRAAAREAAEQGIVIHAVGLGTPQGDLIPSEGGGFKRDRSGEVVMSRLDEGTLREIADMTHGTYRRATPAGGEMEAVYSLIENMEKREFEGRNYVRYQPRFQVPALLAWLLLVAGLALPEGRWGRSGERTRSREAA